MSLSHPEGCEQSFEYFHLRFMRERIALVAWLLPAGLATGPNRGEKGAGGREGRSNFPERGGLFTVQPGVCQNEGAIVVANTPPGVIDRCRRASGQIGRAHV